MSIKTKCKLVPRLLLCNVKKINVEEVIITQQHIGKVYPTINYTLHTHKKCNIFPMCEMGEKIQTVGYKTPTLWND